MHARVDEGTRCTIMVPGKGVNAIAARLIDEPRFAGEGGQPPHCSALRSSTSSAYISFIAMSRSKMACGQNAGRKMTRDGGHSHTRTGGRHPSTSCTPALHPLALSPLPGTTNSSAASTRPPGEAEVAVRKGTKGEGRLPSERASSHLDGRPAVGCLLSHGIQCI